VKVILRPIKKYAEEILEGGVFREDVERSIFLPVYFLMESIPLFCDTLILAYLLPSNRTNV
jgi:hypothetical protein